MQKKNIVLVIFSFSVTAVLLTLIQPPIGLSSLAWVALVPFILICSPKIKPWHLAITAYLVSLVYWLGNLYWMLPVTIAGWLAFCLYTAILWPLLAICIRYCRLKKIPLTLAVPVFFVAVERLQGLLLSGFFWRFLAHSQFENINLIQIADIFGAAGVSFLVALVNGLLAEIIIAYKAKSIFKAGILLKAVIVAAIIAASFLYGYMRINQSAQFVTEGPLAAALQSNIPQTVKESPDQAQPIFEELLEKTRSAADAGADLIIWPETMAQAYLDKRILGVVGPVGRDAEFDRILSELAVGTADILVGAYGGAPEFEENGTIGWAKKYNSAFLYKRDGQQAKEQYNKIHLVPFGEVVPFKKSIPWLYRLLMVFTPYDYDYSLDYGTEYTVFDIEGGAQSQKRDYKFGVMICYEDTIPKIARKFTLDDQGRKQLDFLVNISNDGWFVRFKNGRIHPSTELAQHTAVCVFRAVENRLSVIRSVNTGISCNIDTLGRIRDGFIAGNLPQKAFERTAVAGWFVDNVSIDKRETFFSKHGQWLDFCCTALFFMLIIIQIAEKFAKKHIKG